MDKQLLDRFIKGECTAEEAARVQQWLDEHPEAFDEYLQGIWEEPVTNPMPAALEQSLLTGAANWPGYQETTMAPKTNRHWLYWSAAAAIIIAIAGWWLFAPQQRFTTEQAGQQSTIVAVSATATQRYVLPDQSVVWLKANARMRVDTQTYKQRVRMVELLAGEAFFEVQKDPAHPFVVQNGAIQTKVLGTSFSVQTGLPGDGVRVTVATGKVAVSHKEKLLNVLLPGKQISVQSKTGAFKENTVPVWLASLWKENELQLTNAPFTELQLAMENLYGINLKTNSRAVSAQRYNIKLNRNTPVKEVIQVLALLNQHQYKKMNNTTWLLY
jgi:ferric-dicitrate binding protein FerR (iron transport regulator)